MSRRFYFREFYGTNRRVWPSDGRLGHFLDAFKLAAKCWWRAP